jgi:hypothetical protein
MPLRLSIFLPYAIVSARSRNGPPPVSQRAAPQFRIQPNVAPTELVPALVAGEDVVLARFGINRLGSADKPRPPLLNVRTDGMRNGQFRKPPQGTALRHSLRGFL